MLAQSQSYLLLAIGVMLLDWSLVRSLDIPSHAIWCKIRRPSLTGLPQKFREYLHVEKKNEKKIHIITDIVFAHYVYSNANLLILF